MDAEVIKQLIKETKRDLEFHTEKVKKLKIQIKGYELLVEDRKIRDRKKELIDEGIKNLIIK